MNPLNLLFIKRRKSYKKVFDQDDADARRVLSDLRKFCRGTGSKYMGDRDKTHVMIGRNEVWERIISYLNVTEEDIAKLVEQIDE